GGCVAVLSGALGTLIGVLASVFKILDHILMRICDGLMAIPALLLAVALAAALGPSMPNLIAALTVVATPSVARLVRARALAVMSETFVEASRAQGAGPAHIIIRHVLPNVLSVLAVQVTFIFADAIITEAALSFLGAGVPTPRPSWGNILYDGKGVILQAPIMTVAASAALVITVLALNLLGDGLRDLVDPRAQHNPRGPGALTRLIGFRRTVPTAGDAR
ncbi:MAG: peptide transporter permease, partial [Mycobacterium sp.]|nr:peptide transporter permease [Mycobacterium sp.]